MLAARTSLRLGDRKPVKSTHLCQLCHGVCHTAVQSADRVRKVCQGLAFPLPFVSDLDADWICAEQKLPQPVSLRFCCST